MDGELKLFNTTIYDTNNSAKNLVSKFQQLQTALERYNSLEGKSASFRTKYSEALDSSNTSLSKYIKSLNGGKATLRGYIASLIEANVATITLKVASIALNTAITAGLSFGISTLVSWLTQMWHAEEEARQKAIELANSYKEQQNSLDSQIEKYRELKTQLDAGNLSTNETRSIKEQLLEIQKSLIESYGNEAANIDLVNGKYEEQTGLLSELSKQKATDFIAENMDVFEDASKALNKIRTYNIGSLSFNTSQQDKADIKKLRDFIKSRSELIDETNPLSYSKNGLGYQTVQFSIKANVEDAEEVMRQLSEDLQKYGEENGIDVSSFTNKIAQNLRTMWTDSLSEYKEIYDEYIKAEIVKNDTLRPLYQE